MFRADFVRGAEYIPPIGFHMQEIAQAHIGLQAMNYTPRLSFSQDGPVAPSKLADRVGNLHPVPRRPKENILPPVFIISSRRLVMGIVKKSQRDEKACVRINVHWRNLRNRATVSTFLPGWLRSALASRRRSMALFLGRRPALVTIKSGFPFAV